MFFKKIKTKIIIILLTFFIIPISTQAYSKEIIAACREHRDPVIIPRFSCHIIRHTFCARLCENETNIKVIQSVMGHKDIQTTMNIYAEVSDQKISDVFKEINENIW